MSTNSATQTFTRTDAKYLASKVVADLYQCSRFYDKPQAAAISNYEEELIELLAHGYLSDYEFGFRKDGKRIVCWRYEVRGGDLVGTDDSSGRLYARADVTGADHYNHVTYTSKWYGLTQAERASFKAGVPISRSNGDLPGDGSGYWAVDKTYSSSGTAVSRRTYRPT